MRSILFINVAALGRSRINDSRFGFLLLLDCTRLHQSRLLFLKFRPHDHLAAGPAHRLAARASRCRRKEDA